MITIPFRDWTLTVDREVTEPTYASVANGSAEGCKCNDCLNYVANRADAFPEEIKLLFGQLGVDYRKESKVSRMYKFKDGIHIYNGFFHFKGSFEGKDCFVTSDGRNGSFSMTDIDESFSIGFRVADQLAYFKRDDILVQIEFETKIPWVIDRKSWKVSGDY
jgi:hypothetical protein